MNYRELGATGLRVSEIGLGCEGFIGQDWAYTKELFDYALANGVNCMDLYSPNPEMHRNVARAIAGVREKFVLQAHLCTRWRNGQYEATRKLSEVKEAFEVQLQNLGTEDVEELWADKSYENHLFNLDPQREELYETCQRMGVGITVMKAFGGGDLLSETDSPAGKAMTAVQCLHYALTRPAVGAVMCGARSLDDLKRSLAYESATDEEKDYAAVFATFPKISWEGHCMYCGHYAPCPKGIAIADVTKFLNLTKAQGMVPETVVQHYSVLTAHGGDCIQCGACETRCPFGVKIRENMAEAKVVFGY